MEKSELPVYWILGALYNNIGPFTKEFFIEIEKDRMSKDDILTSIDNLLKNESIEIKEDKLYITEKGRFEMNSIIHNIKGENEKHTLGIDSLKLTIEHLKTNTKDIKKNPYRFWSNFGVSIVGALTGIFALIFSVNQNTEIKELKKSYSQQDSILRKYVSDKYEFLRKNSIKAENDILLLKKQANDSTTKPSSIKHLSKP